ncbi:hypothetical protein BJ878DRAFT_287091 [Calycina marina]|uniref:Sialidase n=1 Tax=Calycina marina TaxID=1763456 RepID=A0A9P7ZBG4_9HELO|nr:hypothetical protein BJ878DRAFT_287091 [Calycina marina]
MSFDYSFSLGPLTPPDLPFEDALNEASFSIGSVSGHSRSSSHVSMYSQESSPDTANTQLSTPSRSPIRQHGPLLLPKIRHQDQEIHHSPPKRFKKILSNKSQTLKPTHTRSYTNPEAISFDFDDSFPSQTRSMATLCSPISLTTTTNAHQRRSSVPALDGQTISKYGFPTYRQMPSYIPSEPGSRIETFTGQPTYIPQRTPSPLHHSIEFGDMLISPIDNGQTTIMAYLTAPNPAPALVRQLNVHVRDPSAKHAWWDIRQIRPWTSFTPTTISSIPGLHALLNIHLPTSTLPTPPRPSSQPETETELAAICTAFYASKLNAALSLSLGQRHLAMRPTKGDAAGFLSNYTDDASSLIYGRTPGLARVVGLVKSFDRWNTGMRVEGNHRKVEYLRGLAHLHAKMRENSCRYGFIITEIELVVVRNGAEATPHFGYLEVHSVQLAAHSPPASTCLFSAVENNFALEGEVEELVAPPQKMTALLALWYLHMLAKDERLGGQVSWKSEIGAPAEGTRRKCLPKDEWIPEPQLAEKRECKRARGWVWPEEAVGRKELGKRGVRYGNF